MLYVVLGMHKSGTTLVSEILDRSGVRMTEDASHEDGYDEGNFSERRAFVELNQDILGFGNPAWKNHRLARSLELTPAQQARMSSILQQAACAEDWGFKDPRTCLTYAAWEPALPEHRIIAVYRGVDQVCAHLHRRQRASTWKAVSVWCDYNEHILDILEPTRRDSLLLSYERLMTSESEFRRLAQFMQRDLVDNRQPERFRPGSTGRGWLAAVDAMRALRGLPRSADVMSRLGELRERQCREGGAADQALEAGELEMA